jgi:hypothetical protein
LRVFVRNCAECHEPPFFTTAVNLELAPDLPDPIAKLHAYTLVRNAFADAFKERMIANGVPHGLGVNDAVRPFLGNRRFYFDQERLPDIEALVGPLLIELMGIPDKRPTTFLPAVVFPGAGKPDRKPMITWTGTRPPLEFEPSPKPGEDPSILTRFTIRVTTTWVYPNLAMTGEFGPTQAPRTRSRSPRCSDC